MSQGRKVIDRMQVMRREFVSEERVTITQEFVWARTTAYESANVRISSPRSMSFDLKWGVQDFEAHVLPFWTLALVCDQVVTQRFKQERGTFYVETPKRIQSEIGFTIAAVAPDHWASGYTISDSVGLHVMQLGELHSYSRHLPADLSWLPSGTPRIYSDPNDGCEPFVSSIWNPSVAPHYALSPPRLTETEVEKIITLQEHDQETWSDVWYPKGIEVFAIPTYKLVYKVVTRSGLGVLDAQQPERNHNTMAIDWSPGGTRGTNAFLWKNLGFQQRPRQPDGRLRLGDPQIWRFQPSTKITTLFSIVHEAMKRRGPMTPEMWEDKRIFPDFGPSSDGNSQTLHNWIRDQVSGNDSLREPQFPLRGSRGSAGAQPSIFASRIRPKTSAAKPTTSDENTTSSASSNRASPTDERPTGRFGASSVDKRRAYIRNRAKLAGDAILRSSSFDKGSALSRYPKVLPDPKGHYRRLGIYEPGREYLELKTRGTADQKINDQYFAYSKELHPDRGGSSEEFAPLADANKALETLEKRLAYYRQSQ
ncbi:hypothetical protein IAT40_000973 [Kwoniella sp. CBS 6097]